MYTIILENDTYSLTEDALVRLQALLRNIDQSYHHTITTTWLTKQAMAVGSGVQHVRAQQA
jgi:hypothetical protein